MANSQMFVDRVRVFAQAGNGGRGCVSFRREKFVPKGGPDGGDGGRGGDVILRANEHVDHLANLFYEPMIKAKNGGHGMGKKMHGKNGLPKIVAVPVGTIAYRIAHGGEWKMATDPENLPAAGNQFSEIDEIADLTRPDDEFVLCRGGAGGKGNVHFKSSRNRAPRQFTEGGEGESGYFLLELRTIADAALVGYPNAGKSTLLRQISAAQPKVAAYPFTTLHPVVGVVEFSGYERATVADIPGLIEGAHRNLGLGHEFLRHITRCRLLVFVLDMAGSENRSPIADFESLRREIKLYDARLSERSWFVVANKMDLPGATANLRQFVGRFPQASIVAVSAKNSTGITEVKEALHAALKMDSTPAEMPEPANNKPKAAVSYPINDN